MNNELFERLLYEDETSTLDFKKEQYRFVKATDAEKSELLKDILGFANAWRRSEAYILIGVEDVRGARGKVVGIPPADHLHDHSLQQFVNNLTNQPVRFHYEAFGFEGNQVGVISIAEQTRPIYLKRDYGKLVKEKVYIRRGSSTDPTKPASPEEIAQMGIGSPQPAAELLVELAHVEQDVVLGTSTSWDAEFCEMPVMETIPDLQRPRPRQRHAFSIDALAIQLDPMDRPNEEFFRELANFEFVRRLFRPIRLVVRNVGQVAAKNVRAELTVPTNIEVMVVDVSKIPAPPKRRADFLRNSIPTGITPTFRRYPGAVGIDRNEERFLVEVDCGDLQPGRQVWSDVFYIAKGTSGDLSLCGLVFANNLPRPKHFALTVSIVVTKAKMTVDELCSLPEWAVQDE
jgi:hypothetical protein